MLDRLNRPLHDLRISVTDRCNFRCGYCMPAGVQYRFLPKAELLSFEEITKVSAMFLRLGVCKLRLTGGEPLLRKNIERLIGKLSRLEGIADLAMTTNGYALSKQAVGLKQAGLQRVTVSLDSLDPKTFAVMNGRGAKLAVILAGIEAAQVAGLAVKINMVVQSGVNDSDLVPMAAFFRNRGIVLRYIEYMDVGNLNKWHLSKVMSGQDILAQLGEHFPFDPLPPRYPGEVAKRYSYRDGGGEFGVVASVTQPFCGACSRTRLSASGHLYTCLFANHGYDLKSDLRGSGGLAQVEAKVKRLWQARADRYSEARHESQQELGNKEKVEMYYIGG